MSERIVEMLRESFGLDPTRGGLVGTLNEHVSMRLATLGIDERDYIARVRDDADERQRLVHAVTVRHSWFYRDPGQLERLAVSLRDRHASAPSRPLEIWVAGCAGGEEAWTIAMIATDLGIPIRMLATDLDARALVDARAGQYGGWSLRELPESLARFLEPVDEGSWRIGAELRRLDLEFGLHNLCDPPPRAVDIISCRNVLIYFEPARAKTVVKQLRESLRPEGELILGAGDLLFQVADPDSGASARTRTEPATPRPQLPQRPSPAAPGISFTPVPTARLPVPIVADKVPHTIVAKPPEDTPRAERARAPTPRESAPGWESKLAEAGQAVEAGDYDSALTRLAEIVAADPLDAEAHLWTGIAQFGLGAEQLASEALRRARCLVPQLWPATLFAALTHERRGMWEAATRCWIELERAIMSQDAPPIEGTAVLLDALPRWRAEALSLARQRISKHAGGGAHD